MTTRLGLSTRVLGSCLCLALFGCDDELADSLVAEAQPFVDGVAKDTEGDAFRIVLSSRDGELGVGENHVVIRVGFHDPNDPLAPGLGIPSARIAMNAWMPLDDGFISHDLSARYVGDGQYLVDPIELDRAGIWQLDFDIAVGTTIREDVSFAFTVDE